MAGIDDVKVGTIMPWAVNTLWGIHAANYTAHEPRMAMMDDPEIVVDAIVRSCLTPKEERPVGWKAKASDMSHHLMPDLTERMSANVAKKKYDRGGRSSSHTGAIYRPVLDGMKMDGAIRARMMREDREY